MKRYVAYSVEILVLIVFGLVAFGARDVEGGASFILPNFPYSRQETEWYCGDASLQMVYQYLTGITVPQDLFSNVARTSSDVGTLSTDVVRALRYSRMSSPASRNSSVSWRGTGYPGRDVGFSAVLLALDTPWYDTLRKTIMAGTPVIVLQQFLPSDSGGHFRVVYGFNATHIFTKDPWGRVEQPSPDFILTYEEFTSLWNYAEFPNQPKFRGVAAIPWRISVQPPTSAPSQGLSVALTVSYAYESPIPSHLVEDQINAQKVILEISYDPAVWLAAQAPLVLSAPLNFGATQTGTFDLTCIASTQACRTSSVSIRASGLVSSSVPSTVRSGSLKFPAYEYMDIIGSAWTNFSF